MKLTRYHPSILRLQADFAARLARDKYTAGRGSKRSKGKIQDNSEPWLRDPDSVADYMRISALAAESEALWLQRFNRS